MRNNIHITEIWNFSVPVLWWILELCWNYSLFFFPPFFPPPSWQVPVLMPMDLMVEASPRRIFANAHTYHINSISVNSDHETYLSADDLRINLWHLEITDRSFSILSSLFFLLVPACDSWMRVYFYDTLHELYLRNGDTQGMNSTLVSMLSFFFTFAAVFLYCCPPPDIVDIKPANMEELTEVITAAECHPHQCNVFVYSSSKGTIRLCDMRAAALCDRHSKCK